MISHQIINPVIDQLGRIIGFNQLVINDFNHVFAVDLSHDDIYNLGQDLMPLFILGPGANVRELNDNELTGYRISAESYGDVIARITNGGYITGAQFRIRNILAVTATTITIPHGRINNWRMEIFVHCDVYPP